MNISLIIIKGVTEIKFLVIIIDNLSLVSHINYIKAKMSKMLNNVQGSLDTSALYNSLTNPYLIYRTDIWVNKQTKHKFNLHLTKKAIEIITGSNRRNNSITFLINYIKIHRFNKVLYFKMNAKCIVNGNMTIKKHDNLKCNCFFCLFVF